MKNARAILRVFHRQAENLGAFSSRGEAEKHERAVPYFKHKG